MRERESASLVQSLTYDITLTRIAKFCGPLHVRAEVLVLAARWRPRCLHPVHVPREGAHNGGHAIEGNYIDVAIGQTAKRKGKRARERGEKLLKTVQQIPARPPGTYRLVSRLPPAAGPINYSPDWKLYAKFAAQLKSGAALAAPNQLAVNGAFD